MPIYEYKCRDCSKVFEEISPLNGEKTPPCPACKGENTEKIISLVGVKTSPFIAVTSCSTPPGSKFS